MRLPRVLVAPVPARPVADGDAAPLGRGVERQDSHRAEFYATGDAPVGPRAIADGYNRDDRSAASAMSALAQRSRPHVAPPPTIVTIASLDQEGRGIARVDGKAVFVEGALPGEAVAITTLKRKPTYEIARADAIAEAQRGARRSRAARISASAAAARCSTSTPARRSPPSSARSRTRCGTSAACAPEQMLPPIHGPAWGYRHRARLSVRHVAKKGGVLVGFHERKSSYVADMTSCAVLPPQDLGPAAAAARADRRR